MLRIERRLTISIEVLQGPSIPSFFSLGTGALVPKEDGPLFIRLIRGIGREELVWAWLCQVLNLHSWPSFLNGNQSSKTCKVRLRVSHGRHLLSH